MSATNGGWTDDELATLYQRAMPVIEAAAGQPVNADSLARMTEALREEGMPVERVYLDVFDSPPSIRIVFEDKAL
jgi:hypothetical protein